MLNFRVSCHSQLCNKTFLLFFFLPQIRILFKVHIKGKVSDIYIYFNKINNSIRDNNSTIKHLIQLFHCQLVNLPSTSSYDCCDDTYYDVLYQFYVMRRDFLVVSSVVNQAHNLRNVVANDVQLKPSRSFEVINVIFHYYCIFVQKNIKFHYIFTKLGLKIIVVCFDTRQF